MKEIEDIIQAYRKASEAGKQTALATVVHVEGSSYRRPGARMLVTDDGQLTGAISGGCLERRRPAESAAGHCTTKEQARYLRHFRRRRPAVWRSAGLQWHRAHPV